jgi:GAF domain-containing protein
VAAPAARERDDLGLLCEASLEFNSTLDPEELLGRVFDRVLEALDAEAGSIWLREGEQVVCRLGRGPMGTEVEGVELPLGAGIVGDVALRGEARILADAREDPRFVHQVDEATGFVTRSVLAAPLKAKDEVLGVLQLLNKRSGTGRFDARDGALLASLAATAGLALHNARLHDAERRARDLGALVGISREISATLDVDRLLLSLVNLGSQVIAYDLAAAALDERGRAVLRAVSGRETVGRGAETDRDLERLIAFLVERDGIVYVEDLAADGDGTAAVRGTFGPYLERAGVRSLCLVPLKDEEGRLGAFYMHSRRPGFLGGAGREAAELLANQATVALRNAQLHGQVPLIGLLEPLAAWRRRLAALPRRRLATRIGIPAGLLLAAALFPWHERIPAREARLLPALRTPVRATVGGLVAEVRVAEGEAVASGGVLAVLRGDDLRKEALGAEAALAVAERRMTSVRARGDEAAAQAAQAQARELSGRLGLLREQLERTSLRAPVDGVVLTARPHERLGEWLGPGDAFVVLGRTDRLEVEARVAQRDIDRVRTGQRLRLRTPARPEYTFVGTVTAVAPAADQPADGGEPTFLVRASLDNSRALLRPGLEARAKIVGALRPVGLIAARPLIRWIRMHLWR